jgi:hypothetical protein
VPRCGRGLERHRNIAGLQHAGSDCYWKCNTPHHADWTCRWCCNAPRHVQRSCQIPPDVLLAKGSRGMPRSHYPAHTLGPFSLLPTSIPLLGLVGRLAGPRLDEQLHPDAQRDLEPRGERVRADCAASLRTAAPGSFAMGGRAARRYGQALGPPLRAPAPGLLHAPRAAPSGVGARTHRARQRPFRRGAAASAPARAPLAPTPARRRQRRRRRRRRRRRSPSS